MNLKEGAEGPRPGSIGRAFRKRNSVRKGTEPTESGSYSGLAEQYFLKGRLHKNQPQYN